VPRAVGKALSCAGAGPPLAADARVFRVADRDETPTARPTVKADGKLAGGLIAGKRLGR
jgi:hypothetical protein